MKEIKLYHLRNCNSRHITLVDDEDYDYLNQWKWSFKNGYAVRKTYGGVKRSHISMHRLIMNTPEGMEVDHKDHNGLNNQKYNLRNCNKAQNLSNRNPYGKSKYMGVSIHSCIKNNKKYFQIVAVIKKNGISKRLGSFKTEVDAAKAYDKAAKEIHGEFANLNFKEKLP